MRPLSGVRWTLTSQIITVHVRYVFHISDALKTIYICMSFFPLKAAYELIYMMRPYAASNRWAVNCSIRYEHIAQSGKGHDIYEHHTEAQLAPRSPQGGHGQHHGHHTDGRHRRGAHQRLGRDDRSTIRHRWRSHRTHLRWLPDLCPHPLRIHVRGVEDAVLQLRQPGPDPPGNHPRGDLRPIGRIHCRAHRLQEEEAQGHRHRSHLDDSFVEFPLRP